MQKLSLIWGILALLSMLTIFIPYLNSFIMIAILFSVAGLIISIVALTIAKDNKGFAIAGIICCASAVIFGLLIVAYFVFDVEVKSL